MFAHRLGISLHIPEYITKTGPTNKKNVSLVIVAQTMHGSGHMLDIRF